jgi:DNA-binding transcriptional regulator YiaG
MKGEELRQIRLFLELSVPKFAELLACSQNHVYAMERNLKGIGEATARLARMLMEPGVVLAGTRVAKAESERRPAAAPQTS